MKRRAQDLLKRLITRNNYYLALQIAKYLKMPEKEGSSYILVHWAKYKVCNLLFILINNYYLLKF